MTSRYAFILLCPLLGALAGCSETPEPSFVPPPVDARVADAPSPDQRVCHTLRSDGVCLDDAPPNDRDLDGYTNDVDCDDYTSTSHPGGTEVECNGLDDDCIDGDFCPPDADGDGFRGRDCDDSNPAINPDGYDILCNGVDEDCIEGDRCDADGDGMNAGWLDCDDTDPTRYRGAPEIGCNGVIEDCQRTVDCCDQDEDLDGYACRNECNDSDERVFPGSTVRTCEPIDIDCDGEIAEDLPVECASPGL